MTRHAVMTVLGLVLSCGVAAAQTPAAPAQTPARPAQTPAAPATPAAAPQPVPFPADAHIAIINMSRVLAGSRIGQAGQAALKATNDKWTSTLQGLAGRAQGLQQELQTQQATLTSAQYSAKKVEADKAQLEIQYSQRQAQAEMEQLSRRLSDDFDVKVIPVIEALRKERNLWFLVEVSDEEQEGEHLSVLAAHPGIELSAEVIKRLNAL